MKTSRSCSRATWPRSARAGSGVVHDRSPIGRRHVDFLLAEAEVLGLAVVALTSVGPLAEDATAEVDQVLTGGPDGLVYLGLGLAAPAVARALTARGWEGPRAMNTAGIRGRDPEFGRVIDGWVYIDMYLRRQRDPQRAARGRRRTRTPWPRRWATTSAASSPRGCAVRRAHARGSEGRARAGEVAPGRGRLRRHVARLRQPRPRRAARPLPRAASVARRSVGRGRAARMTSSSTAGGPAVGLMLPTVANTDDDRVDATRVIDAARVRGGGRLRRRVRRVITSSIPARCSSPSSPRARWRRRPRDVAVGFCVLLVALRPTVLLAQQLATLAAFAPGRLRIGVGVGGEYPAGVRDRRRPARGAGPPHRRRSARAAVAPGGPPDVNRRSRRIRDRGGYAPAAPGTVPLLFAGWSEPALRRAAQLGDGWIGYLLARRFRTPARPAAGAPRRARDVRAVHDRDAAPGVVRRRGEWRGGMRAGTWSRVIANDAALPDRLFARGRRRRSSTGSMTIGNGGVPTWC